jgi:PPOX class probable F420-dependent enzyme
MAIQIDTTTDFGKRVEKRLNEELIVWLTTTGKDGTPHPKPVWFHFDGETILVYSKPDTAKLRHITQNPRVSLNLNSDQYGNDVVVVTGSAVVDEDAPACSAIPAYVEKYQEGIGSIGMTPESFAAAYNVAVRITPDKLSGF